jgi:hypothetical protein
MTNRTVLAEFDLDPDVIHLNHGAFGAVRRLVGEAWRRTAREIETNPHRFVLRRLADRVAAARHEAATALELPEEEVAVARNVSEAASVLGSLDLGPGEEIVVSSQGDGSVRMSVESWCRRTGATVRSSTARASGGHCGADNAAATGTRRTDPGPGADAVYERLATEHRIEVLAEHPPGAATCGRPGRVTTPGDHEALQAALVALSTGRRSMAR